jgi:hypothetical protein
MLDCHLESDKGHHVKLNVHMMYKQDIYECMNGNVRDLVMAAAATIPFSFNKVFQPQLVFMN